MPVTLLGPRELTDILVPTGIDAAVLLNFENRNGLNPMVVMAQAAGILAQANATVYNNWSGTFYVSEDQFARYAQGNGDVGKTPVATEYAKTDPVRSDETGHMLPLRDFTDALGWTPKYLRMASQSQIDNDLSLIRDRWVNRFEADIINRIFSNAEAQIGTSGWSVPWANGAGNVPYIPPQVGSTSFDNTHTHFLWEAGSAAANFKALMDKMVSDLRHHRIRGNLVATVSDADVTTWAAVDGFVELQPEGVMILGSSTDRIQVTSGKSEGIPGETFGWYKSLKGMVELKYNESVPTGYIFLTRSYGPNNVENGVAIRLFPDVPFGLMPKPTVTDHLHPEMKTIEVVAEYGVGTNKRINGVVGQVANGISEYTPPASL